MSAILTALLVFSVVLMNLSFSKDPDWRRILPLRSTRADVERMLGPSKGAYFADYSLEEGNLFIEYSSGPCRPGRKNGWNVAKDVVVKVSFTPKHKRRVAQLKLDPIKFRRVIDDHVGRVLYYVNDENGITYEVQRGRIDVEYYEPPSRYEHLYCGPADQKTPGGKLH